MDPEPIDSKEPHRPGWAHMLTNLRRVDDRVLGELALTIAPGTPAAVRDKLLDSELSGPLNDLAKLHDVALAAAPAAFARPCPGKDEDGRTRFEIHGRVEGDRLVPVRLRTSKPKRSYRVGD